MDALALMLVALAASRSKAGLPTAAVATLGALVVLGLGYRTDQAGGDLVCRHSAASAYAGLHPSASPSPDIFSLHGGGDQEKDDDD